MLIENTNKQWSQNVEINLWMCNSWEAPQQVYQQVLLTVMFDRKLTPSASQRAYARIVWNILHVFNSTFLKRNREKRWIEREKVTKSSLVLDQTRWNKKCIKQKEASFGTTVCVHGVWNPRFYEKADLDKNNLWENQSHLVRAFRQTQRERERECGSEDGNVRARVCESEREHECA